MTGKETGSIFLTGQCVPALQTGEYELNACIQVRFPGEREDSETERKRFLVQGQRFSLKQEQIAGVYPAPGERCENPALLPHAVVSPCTLPFECTVVSFGECMAAPSRECAAVPFLALLLFREEEMPELVRGHVRDLFQHDADCGVFYSGGCTKEEAGVSCTFMDVPAALFERIAPSEDELAFLVHGRKADPMQKARALSELPADEVQSVIFCNRTPKCGTAEDPFRNHVCLVSFAGCGGIWEKCRNYRSVRLAVLHHWEFFAAEDSGGEKLLEHVPVRGFSLPVPERAGKRTKDLLQNGYVLLEHVLRDGSRTASFYRGPFVPGVCAGKAKPGDSPDALYRYDPECGMFDMSYACAWEAGKLAALSREDIARKILAARKEAFCRMRRESVKGMLADAGIQEDVREQLLFLFEKCYGNNGKNLRDREADDEVMVSEREGIPDGESF